MSIDFEQIESSQRQHNETLLHNEKVCNEAERHAFAVFNELKPAFKKDGNQWCVLFGDDLQVGIAGFGSSLRLAIWNWFERFKQPIVED